MERPRVVYVSPFDPSDQRWAELGRVFGQDVEIIQVAHLDFNPTGLAQTIQEAEPDAVVLATGLPRHRQAVERLASCTPVLRPMFEWVRNNRGETEQRSAGFERV